MLASEAIHSLSALYRVAGDEKLPVTACGMLNNIVYMARTKIAFAASDVTDEHAEESMQDGVSCIAKSLNDPDLLYSEPDVVNLDDLLTRTASFQGSKTNTVNVPTVR